MYLSKLLTSFRFIAAPAVPMLKFSYSYEMLAYFKCKFKPVFCLIVLFLPAVSFSEDESGRYTPQVRAVYKAMPSTVVISEVKGKYNGTQPKVLGTGVVVDSEGYVLTSEHVIRGYDSLSVITFKGEKYSSKVLFTSQEMDLALIKINKLKEKIPAVRFAFPNDLLLAEPVIAIGNPYGLTFSISDGILSSTGRKLEAKNRMVFDDLLQTSIKVNPGNSGGPLINMNGEMIGLMVASQSEAQGIGFAVPISKIENVVSSWFSPQRQSHAELGFSVVTKFNAEGNTGFAEIVNVQNGKMNNIFGVRNGQRLKSVDGLPIRNAMDFYRYVKNKKPGSQLAIETSKNKKFFVQLFPLKGLTLAKSKLGLRFQRLGPDIARAISMPFDKGFVLSGVEVEEGRGMTKVRRGDMLFKIGDRIIMNDTDLQDLLKHVKSGDKLSVVFLRVIPDAESSHIETVNDYIEVR